MQVVGQCVDQFWFGQVVVVCDDDCIVVLCMYFVVECLVDFVCCVDVEGFVDYVMNVICFEDGLGDY